MVPQSPFGQHTIGATTTTVQTLPKTIQERIEIVVMDDITAVVGMLEVVLFQVSRHLEPHGGLASPFFTEYDRCGWILRITVHLVPGGMVGAIDTVVFEHGIGLSVLLGEGIAGNTVVFEKLLDLHGCS